MEEKHNNNSYHELRFTKDEDKAIATAPPTTDSKMSFFHTCFNGLNAISGIGILSVPLALASGGWLSLFLLFVVAAVTFYTGLLIKNCMDKNSNIRTYADIGELAFGKIGRLIVTISMYAELFLVATGFLILESDNLSNLFPIGKLQVAGLEIGQKHFFIVMVALVILPIVWMNNLSLLSYISASGVFATAIIILSILWTATFDGVGFHQKGTLVHWNGIPTAVSLYTMFGGGVESQVTLNLPLDKISSRIAIYTTLVNPISKYVLMTTPITNALKDLLPKGYNSKVTDIIVSAILVMSTVIVALAVPFFGYLMSLVGALLSVTASILLPCLCYLKISCNYNKFRFETITIVVILLSGKAIGMSGTYMSLNKIVHHMS
uniref:Amino acid transporter transmembrane domain-containing protein n=1 Tax=Lotus japonicus TaxID=34305 RepID=I3SR98_LOTJA|nr:unknown [Lotus japonicus]